MKAVRMGMAVLVLALTFSQSSLIYAQGEQPAEVPEVEIPQEPVDLPEFYVEPEVVDLPEAPPTVEAEVASMDSPDAVQAYDVSQWRVETRLGVGTQSPIARLHVVGGVRIEKQGDAATLLTLATERSWEFRQRGTGANTALELKSIGNWPNGDGGSKDFIITTSGVVEVFGGTLRAVRYGEGAVLLDLHSERNWVFRQFNTGAATALELASIGGGGNKDFLINTTGEVGIGTRSPQAKLDVAGVTRTDVLRIDNGSDLAEPFDIAGAEAVEPGMVVAIDAEHPGQLRIADSAYDHTVAGVVSGAGDIQPGLILQQEGTLADGEHPVALSGRVYVWADASNGAIVPGDLLTTSNTPGHAMKAADLEQAQGAILGKAMTELTEGTGLVLVLVSLQ